MNLSIPIEGIRQAETSFNSSAASITRAFQGNTSANSSGSPSSDTADLSSAVTSLLTAKQDFLANVKVAQVDDNLTRSSFSLLA